MKKSFTPEDLVQITPESLQKLRKNDLIELSIRLRDFGIELYERLNLNSSNSSKPPSSDNPFKKGQTDQTESKDDCTEPSSDQEKETPDTTGNDKSSETTGKKFDTEDNPKRNPGRQPGSQGFGRDKPEAQRIAHHHPQRCMICGRTLYESAQPHTGFYQYELERREIGIDIVCTLHFYYSSVCSCGHENFERPGEGLVSIVEGRKRNLVMKENSIVGPMLATFIASLSRDSRMSRVCIRAFLKTWMNFDLSVGTICKTIREAGIACHPLVEELKQELQAENKIHLDETPWYQKGVFLWLWVAIGKNVAIYHIGTRKKEELLQLITEAFMGWLITDGYGAYRSYKKRQRCLAHLIRKAVALTGAINEEAQKHGEWFLREIRGLIKAMAEGEDGQKECRPILARLKRACNLGSKSDHAKLKSLAKEILNDWDAVVAFVKNPELPATNNEAERALRWWVLYRKISFGTRTDEGSQAFAALISVFETCRLRGYDPYNYVALAIALGRKGITPPPIPQAA